MIVLWTDFHKETHIADLFSHEPLVLAMINTIFLLCDKPQSLIYMATVDIFLDSFVKMVNLSIGFPSGRTCAKGLRTICHLCRKLEYANRNFSGRSTSINIAHLRNNGALDLALICIAHFENNPEVVRWALEAMNNVLQSSESKYLPTELSQKDYLTSIVIIIQNNALLFGNNITPRDINVARAGLKTLAMLCGYDAISNNICGLEFNYFLATIMTCFSDDLAVQIQSCSLICNITNSELNVVALKTANICNLLSTIILPLIEQNNIKHDKILSDLLCIVNNTSILSENETDFAVHGIYNKLSVIISDRARFSHEDVDNYPSYGILLMISIERGYNDIVSTLLSLCGNDKTIYFQYKVRRIYCSCKM